MRFSQGLTLQQTADEFMVYLNGVEQWRQRWNKLGLAGLYEGRHTGRPSKWTSEQRQALGKLAQSEGGTVVMLLRHTGKQQERAPISQNTGVRYLEEMNFSYKRYRYGLKKPNQKAFERAGTVIGELGRHFG